jgi:hypothetical protein
MSLSRPSPSFAAAAGSNSALRRYGATSLTSTASLATNNLLHQMYTPPHGSSTAALVEGGGIGGFGDRQARFSYVDYNEKKYRAEIPVTDPVRPSRMFLCKGGPHYPCTSWQTTMKIAHLSWLWAS